MINLLKIREVAREKNITIAEISEHAGVTPQGLQKMIRENRMEISVLEKVVEKLGVPVETFISFYGTDEALKNAIRRINRAEIEQYDIPEEIIKAPLIGQYANGGYLRGYQDPVYLDEQPVFYSTRRHSKGKYVAFEVKGDSMNDGSLNAICEGDIILGRELQREHWTPKLHIPKVFVVVHRTEGISVKQITKQDLETGVITCHSWNPDLEYQDFEVNLNDVIQLFYIKEVSRNFKM